MDPSLQTLSTPSTSSSLHPLRILIVDDREDLRFTLKELCAILAADAVAVESVEEAEKALNSKHFDVVISDLHLGDGEDGETFLNRLKIQKPDIWRVLLTGSSETALTGGHVLLHKPVSFKELKSAINGSKDVQD